MQLVVLVRQLWAHPLSPPLSPILRMANLFSHLFDWGRGVILRVPAVNTLARLI